MTSMNSIETVATNLHKFEGRYYRMAAKGITPNGCWLIAPVLVELEDIDVATGNDVYGAHRVEFDGVTGTVSANYAFINA